MKNNNLILFGIGTILGIGVYMYWKSKQPKVAEISNLDKSQTQQLSSSSITNVSPLNGSTSNNTQQNSHINSTIVDIPMNTPIQQIAVNQTVLDENQKYLQALAIQSQILASWPGKDIFNLTAKTINEKINPLGYKLKNGNSRDEIVKITI